MDEPDDAEVTVDVVDSTGAHLGRIEGAEPTTLARHLPIDLDDDVSEDLAIDEGFVDLPAALIQRRGADAVQLNRSLDEIRELLEEHEDIEE